jgi:hypothetical protein
MGRYNDHRKLEGKHAYLGCSQSSWENRSDEQLVSMYYSKFAADIGTACHKFAQDCINQKMKLRKTDDHLIDYYIQVVWPMFSGTIIPKGAYDSKMLIETISLFVNDAIGFRMDSEVILAYDETYAFGTSDAFSCDDKEKIIRVSDLKTGNHPVKMTQLLLYAAQYCLEYHKNPKEYSYELRVYQTGEIIEYFPMASEIEEHMQHIVYATKVLRNKIM